MVLPVMADEVAPPDKPMLWEIEGNPLEKPSHLFGTMHLTTSRIAKLHPAAERAFDMADTVATELSWAPKEQMVGVMVMMRDDGDGERERSVGEKLVKSLLTDRDRTMAETIDKMLRDDPAKSRFIAVGAGHLVSETSIVSHLEKKGWKITRITE
jgi:uncharacterized protein YbaP (TraB family)